MRLVEMIRKEYILLVRRRKFTLLILLLPFLLGIIFSLIPNLLGIEEVSIGVCNFDNTLETKQMLASMESEFNVQLFSPFMNCTDLMRQSIREGENMVGILIEDGFSENINNFQQANVYVYFDNTNFNLETYLSWFIDRALDSYKQQVLLEGEAELKGKTENLHNIAITAYSLVNETEKNIGINLDPVQNQFDQFTSLTSLLKNLDTKFLANPVSSSLIGVYPITSQLGIGFVIIFCVLSLFTSFMVGSTGAIYDRNTGYAIRLKTSKTFSVEYLFSKVIVFSGIAILQTVLLLLLFAVRGAEFDINFTGFAAAIFLITALNTMIGVTIGLVSENETIAILISLLFTLPFLFLSGIFAPIQLFPKFIQIFASFFPLGLEIELLKKTSILGTNISSIWYMVESMLNYITAFSVLNIILMRNKN